MKTANGKVARRSIRAKTVRGGHPLLRENLAEIDQPPFKNADFESIRSLVAPQL